MAGTRPLVVDVDCNYDYAYERSRIGRWGADLALRPARAEADLINACWNAEIVLLETADTPVTARVIGALEKCRAIIKYSVGTENIDLAAATQDVMVEEPLPLSSPLRGFDQVILTPHDGARSEDAIAPLRTTVADSVEAILQGHWAPCSANPNVWPRAPLRPWAELSRR